MVSTKKKMISVVIPAYNEESSIGPTIDEIKLIAKSMLEYDFEIIVVDNNSKDKTSEIAKSHGARVLFQPIQGYGAAYKKGMSEAKGDIIITGDADATYPFDDMPRLISVLEQNNYDFLNTNRFAHLHKNSMPVINHVGNIFLTVMTNLIYSSKLKDSQSGMWIFNKKFLDSLVYRIMGNGMSYSQEIKLFALYLSSKNKINFKEVDIYYKQRIGDKKLRPIRDGTDNLLNLFKFKSKLKKLRIL